MSESRPIESLELAKIQAALLSNSKKFNPQQVEELAAFLRQMGGLEQARQAMKTLAKLEKAAA